MILQKHDKWARPIWQSGISKNMKIKLCIAIMMLLGALAPAQTNNLNSLLEQGLLEEQANRNLDAAITDYKELATEFDNDRQLAATAVFRLGECYRTQGKTNEAAVEYHRVLRDFSDQTTLAILSRENLTGMGLEGSLANTNLPAPGQITLVGNSIVGDPTLSAEDEEIQRIQAMIQNSPDLINGPDSSGHTPLENAAINGQLKVAAFLLDHGADVNARGGTALFAATGAGNRAMVEFLLAHGADVNAINNIHQQTPLFGAVQKGFAAVTEVLLANKADVNAVDGPGETPLFYAAQQGTNLIQILLAAGANVNVTNNEGRTPLSFAAEKAPPEVVKMLLDAKADPNGGDLDPPLLCAVYEKAAESVQLLLQAGANPNVKGLVDWQPHSSGFYYEGTYGRGWATPLWLAVDMNQLPIVQLLLKSKADPNDTRIEGESLLFDALWNTNILEALLDAGVQLDARDNVVNQRGTPLEYAARAKNLAAMEILMKHGANPNDSDINGDTPLHYASNNLNPDLSQKVFELLFNYHANPNVRDGQGKSPLDLVKEMEQPSPADFGQPQTASERVAVATQLADLLRQHGALDVLPDWDRITISRPLSHYSAAIFYKAGTNNWNQFTLFDLLGVQYELLSASFGQAQRVQMSPYYQNKNSLPFPDFNRINIHRPSASGTNWQELKFNLTQAFNTGECAADVPLQMGDVVEIPEADHVLNESWTGLSTNELFTLKHCLTRHLQITVNGQTTNLTIAPQVWEILPGSREYRLSSMLWGKMPSAVGLLTAEPFMLWPVLDNSKLLLASSDLSNVSVKRRDAITGKVHDWKVDCSKPSPPNFWLRDGDVIEVPASQ